MINRRKHIRRATDRPQDEPQAMNSQASSVSQDDILEAVTTGTVVEQFVDVLASAAKTTTDPEPAPTPDPPDSNPFDQGGESGGAGASSGWDTDPNS